MNVDLLKCGVCLERYRRPKLLPCFHTYCQQCVEKLADSKPSFPCPACRTVVVIPPGGAANLQANFYLEKDLAKQEAKEGKMCQLCTKGTQAQYKCVQCHQLYCAPCRGIHDSIESCTQHTILPVGGDVAAGRSEKEGVAIETKCPKHKNQLLLLFCCRCEVSICIQCKLTSHDGHETEDVVDAGMKAKTSLKEEAGVLDQHRQLLEAVLAKTDDFYGDLDKEKQAAEEEIRERKKQLQKMISQAEKEALKTVQSTAEAVVDDLKDQSRPLKERHAAVIARRQHINQVIDEGNADDAVALLAKFRIESETSSKGKSGQDNLVIQRSTVGVGYRGRAVRYKDIVSFIGTAREGGLVETKAVSFGALIEREPLKRRQKQSSRPQTLKSEQESGGHGTLSYSEIFYSSNANATFERMTLTSDGGLWVTYCPGTNVYLLSLFDEEGQCLETVYEAFSRSPPFIVCDEDALLSLGDGKWIRPGGETGTLQPSPNRSGATISKTPTPFMLWPNDSTRSVLRISSVSALPPEIDANPVCTYNVNGTYNFDVSADGKFYAFCSSPVSVYDKLLSTTALRSYASYSPPSGNAPSDVCFCEMDRREVLLIAYSAENSVHVVDYRDGCCLIRKLETDGCKLDRPTQLATNHQGQVWVGCQAGKIVVFDL